MQIDAQFPLPQNPVREGFILGPPPQGGPGIPSALAPLFDQFAPSARVSGNAPPPAPLSAQLTSNSQDQPLWAMQTPVERLRASQKQGQSHLPNRYDAACFQEIGLWRAIERSGGLREVCVRKMGMRYLNPPWQEMPAQGKTFTAIASIPLPGAGQEGSDVLVTSSGATLPLQVPLGMDAALFAIVLNYTGTGFVEGSGDITWRLAVGRRFAKDYGAVQVQLGSLTTPGQLNPGAIRAVSQDWIRVYVNLKAGANTRLTGGYLIASVSGWNYPR